jgi:hypothetical protein
LDLLSLLKDGKIFAFGAKSRPKRLNNGRVAAGGSHLSGAGGVFVDINKLDISGDKVRSLLGGSVHDTGELILLDIPLCGHSVLQATCSLPGQDISPIIRLEVIDQSSGDKIGTISMGPLPGRPAKGEVALYGIFGRAAILLKFDAFSEGEIRFEALCVQ